MRQLHRVDGIRYRVQDPDIDGDGQVGGVETLHKGSNNALLDVQESSQMRDVMDTLIAKNREGINFLGNMTKFETQSAFRMKALSQSNFNPKFTDKTVDTYIEISNSENARGRNDIRDVSIGIQEKEESKLKNFMGMGNGN